MLLLLATPPTLRVRLALSSYPPTLLLLLPRCPLPPKQQQHQQSIVYQFISATGSKKRSAPEKSLCAAPLIPPSNYVYNRLSQIALHFLTTAAAARQHKTHCCQLLEYQSIASQVKRTFWERRGVTVKHFQEGSSFRVLLIASSIRRVIIHS